MNPFWHPLSTILLDDPPCFATAALLRMFMKTAPTTRLVYCGDRMSPALSHGTAFEVAAPAAGAVRSGAAVLVESEGILDLLRVRRRRGDFVELAADSDPNVHQAARADELLGVAGLPEYRPVKALARLRRLRLDVREALRGTPDEHEDPAESVKDKYDSQAPLYAARERIEIEPGLLGRIRNTVPTGERVLVVGCGVGAECFSLAREGWRVTGLDFSPAMIERASKEAARVGLDVEFLQGDVRGHAFDRGSFASAVFTYDVYSFVPGRMERIDVLRSLRATLPRDGSIFLSARRLKTAYQRVILTLQHRSGTSRVGEWGDSHTRWIGPDGRLRRSYVHVFPRSRLRAEIEAGGFDLRGWERGHGLLRPKP